MIKLELSPVKATEIHLKDWYPDFTDLEWLKKEIDRQRINIDAILESSVQKLAYRNMKRVFAETNICQRYYGIQKCADVADIVRREMITRRYGKLVIFTVSRNVTAYLQELLSSFYPLVLYPGTPPSKRETHIKKFTTLPRHRVMFVTLNVYEDKPVNLICDEAMFVESDLNAWTNARAVRCLKSEADILVRYMTIPGSQDEAIQTHFMKKTQILLDCDVPEPRMKRVYTKISRFKTKVETKNILKHIKADKIKTEILKEEIIQADPELVIPHQDAVQKPQDAPKQEITIFDVQAVARKIMDPLPGELTYLGVERVSNILRKFGARNVRGLQKADYPAFIDLCKIIIENNA